MTDRAPTAPRATAATAVPVRPCVRRGVLPAVLAVLAAVVAAPAAPPPAAAPAAAAAPSAAGPAASPDMGLQHDAVLLRLVDESLGARTELRQVVAAAQAERERVPQVGALPDPVLGFGIQNDSFKRIEIGRAETSFYQVLVSQGLPFPGKRGLRTDIAGLAAQQADSGVSRARLTTEADVRRAYLDLLLARDRLALLARLEVIWQQSAGVAGVRYETGEGTQSDVLRAQLEVARIAQRRALLRAEERMQTQALNRFRGRPLDEAIVSPASVRDAAPTHAPDVDAVVADAVARSPELARAKLGIAAADKRLALSERDRWPDFGVNMGIMPRGGLEPMWTVGFSVGLPVWMDRKQNRAVAEETARAEAEGATAATVEAVLRQRAADRGCAFAALVETVRVYRGGLLVRSRATAESTLVQYRVGRVPFAAVLDANAGYVNDEDGYLVAIAAAQRIAIAAREVSLDPVSVTVGGGMETGGGAASGGESAAGMNAATSATAPAAAEPSPAGGGGTSGGGGGGGM